MQRAEGHNRDKLPDSGFGQKDNERRQLEEQLKIYQSRYDGLFNSISSGVAVYEAVDDGQDFIFRPELWIRIQEKRPTCRWK